MTRNKKYDRENTIRNFLEGESKESKESAKEVANRLITFGLSKQEDELVPGMSLDQEKIFAGGLAIEHILNTTSNARQYSEKRNALLEALRYDMNACIRKHLVSGHGFEEFEEELYKGLIKHNLTSTLDLFMSILGDYKVGDQGRVIGKILDRATREEPMNTKIINHIINNPEYKGLAIDSGQVSRNFLDNYEKIQKENPKNINLITSEGGKAKWVIDREKKANIGSKNVSFSQTVVFDYKATDKNGDLKIDKDLSKVAGEAKKKLNTFPNHLRIREEARDLLKGGQGRNKDMMSDAVKNEVVAKSVEGEMNRREKKPNVIIRLISAIRFRDWLNRGKGGKEKSDESEHLL